MRELTRSEVHELLERPDELRAVWPDAVGDRLDVIVPRHLERDGFRFVADWGGRLHDALLTGLDAPTAVLSTEVGNEPATALYRGRGWEVVVPEVDFGQGYSPFLVMGRELPF